MGSFINFTMIFLRKTFTFLLFKVDFFLFEFFRFLELVEFFLRYVQFFLFSVFFELFRIIGYKRIFGRIIVFTEYSFFFPNIRPNIRFGPIIQIFIFFKKTILTIIPNIRFFSEYSEINDYSQCDFSK